MSGGTRNGNNQINSSQPQQRTKKLRKHSIFQIVLMCKWYSEMGIMRSLLFEFIRHQQTSLYSACFPSLTFPVLDHCCELLGDNLWKSSSNLIKMLRSTFWDLSTLHGLTLQTCTLIWKLLQVSNFFHWTFVIKMSDNLTLPTIKSKPWDHCLRLLFLQDISSKYY